MTVVLAEPEGFKLIQGVLGGLSAQSLKDLLLLKKTAEKKEIKC